MLTFKRYCKLASLYLIYYVVQNTIRQNMIDIMCPALYYVTNYRQLLGWRRCTVYLKLIYRVEITLT